MLKTLLHKQMMEIFRSYFYDAKKNRQRSKASTAMFIVLFAFLMVGVLGAIFTYLSLSMCRPLADAGMGWLYFTLMGLVSILLGAFGSIFNTYASLYKAKDNDLLLSLPIPTSCIMISRLLTVYLMGLMYSGVVILPAIIVYWCKVSVSFGAIAGSLVLLVCISLIVLILSCSLGWVVAKISLKLKNKSFATVLLSLVFIGVYYLFYFKAQTLLQELLLNAAVYGAKIRGAAYPLYLLGRMGEGDLAAILTVTAVVLALFALMWYMLSRSFLKIATATGKSDRKVYRETRTEKRSAFAALFSKELARFTGSPNYMLNCGLGTLFLPALGVFLLIKGSSFLGSLSEFLSECPGVLPVLLCAAVCMVSAMNDSAAPSVSLEGKNLWIAHSLPIAPWDALKAKLSVQLLITAPAALFCSVCMLIAAKCSILESIFVLVLPQLFVIFSALLGLTLGILSPNLTWTNETAPIKQSMAVTIALLGGWVYGILMALLYLFAASSLGAVLYLLLFTLATLAASAALYLWLRHKGSARFAAL